MILYIFSGCSSNTSQTGDNSNSPAKTSPSAETTTISDVNSWATDVWNVYCLLNQFY